MKNCAYKDNTIIELTSLHAQFFRNLIPFPYAFSTFTDNLNSSKSSSVASLIA